MFEKRMSIFTGHFGSGKTEVSVNYAIQLKKIYPQVAISDFDVVNPFFRTADVRKTLEEMGIWVITPVYADTNVDVPALSPENYMLFAKKDYKVVLDVGGDDLGAKVLSSYNDSILHDDYEMFFVINLNRPMTYSVEGILETIREIEVSSRLKVSRLVNNTNLLGETTVEDIMAGGRVIDEVSRKLGIPVAFVSGLRPVLEKLPDEEGMPKLYLDKYIKLPWEHGQ